MWHALHKNARAIPPRERIISLAPENTFFLRSIVYMCAKCLPIGPVIYDRKRWISKNPREESQRSFEIVVLTTQNFREQISRCPVTKPYGKELTQPPNEKHLED